jgi:hypothetical protein
MDCTEIFGNPTKAASVVAKLLLEGWKPVISSKASWGLMGGEQWRSTMLMTVLFGRAQE